MRKLFRFKHKNTGGQGCCENCGYDPSTGELSEKDREIEGEAEKVTIEQEDLEAATKVVVKEVMKVLQPLLDKLHEANEQFRHNQQSTSTDNTPSFEQQIANLQNAAKERIRIQEHKVAKKLRKIQTRFKPN